MVITGLKYPVSKNVTFAKWILEVICVWCTWQKMSVPSKLVVVLKILLFAYFVSLALFIFQIFCMFFDLQCSYFLAVINLLFNHVEVWVVSCKTHDKPTWLNAWLWSWGLPDYKEKVTISLTVFTVESTGSIESVEEADEEAGERGADWKALTGTVCFFLVQML